MIGRIIGGTYLPTSVDIKGVFGIREQFMWRVRTRWPDSSLSTIPPAFVASSVNGTYPVGIASGDLIFMFISDGTAPALPSGFTNLGTGVAYLYYRMCYKVASGAETGSAGAGLRQICVLRGGNTANIAFAFSATHTVTAADSMVVVMGWSDGDSAAGENLVAPSGWTRRANTSPGSPGAAVITLDSLRAAGSYTHPVSISGYSYEKVVFSIG